MKQKAKNKKQRTKKSVMTKFTTKYISTIADKPQLTRHIITNPEEHPKKFKPTDGSVYDIHDIGIKRYINFRRAGINTIKEFIDADISTISQIMGYRENGGTKAYLRGLAVYQNRIIRIQEPKEISDQPIYLDIETDLMQSTIWMIGIYISETSEFIQLVANKPGDEKKILKECVEILSEYRQEHIITYSGSRFDERILRNRFEDLKLTHSQLQFEDIFIDMKKSFAFPLKSYKLGDLSSFYGYECKHPHMDGEQVAMLYEKHANDLTKYRGYKKLCEYNEDDVLSMLGLVEAIYF